VNDIRELIRRGLGTEQLLVDRRKVLAAATGGVSLAAVAGPAASAATRRLPEGWLQNAAVKVTVRPHGSDGAWKIAGTVSGVPLEVIAGNPTAGTGKPEKWDYSGKHGSKPVSYVVQFSATDPDSLTAKGSVGSARFHFTAPRQSASTTKYPVKGKIGSQALSAVCEPHNAAAPFSGKLGKATVKITAKRGARRGIVAVGTATEAKTTGKTKLKVTLNENTLEYTMTGTMSGPEAGIILGLTWWPILAAGGTAN
jgi:hypothetical protein